MDSVNQITAAFHIAGFLLLTFLVFFFNNRWLQGRKARYWTVNLWFPYLIIFIYTFANLFPITNQGDTPAPVSGLIIMGQLIFYPFYLSFIYFISDAFNSDLEES